MTELSRHSIATTLVPPRAVGHSSGDRTRQRLIDEALLLFAEKGIAAVSIRAIVGAAGAQNLSAVHYHFGNKQGLVGAILEDIRTRIWPSIENSLTELQAIAEKRQATVREIVDYAYTPYLRAVRHSEDGSQMAQFLARLTWEEGAEGQTMLMDTILNPILDIIRPMLVGAMPEKPAELLNLHLLMSLTNLVHGMADVSLQEITTVTALRTERDPTDTRQAFLDYLASGLAA